MQVINKITGEIYTKETNVKTLSEGRRQLSVKIKELKKNLKEVDELLRPHIDKVLEEGGDELGGYWRIIRGSRRFSAKKFKQEATKEEQKKRKNFRNLIKQLEEPYKTHGNPYLRHPKIK